MSVCPHRAAPGTPAAAPPTDSYCSGSSSGSWPVGNTPAPPVACTWTSLSLTSHKNRERENEETILVHFQVFDFQVNTINPEKSIQRAATH